MNEIAVGMNHLGRPFLTVLVATIYNLALLIALITGKLDTEKYIMAVGPINAMITGFWFGERKSMYENEAQEDFKVRMQQVKAATQQES